VKQGVLDGIWKADQLVTLQEHTQGLEYLHKIRSKPFHHNAATIVLSSLYSGSGMRHVLPVAAGSCSCSQKAAAQASRRGES
jgi:hypothetical protein